MALPGGSWFARMGLVWRTQGVAHHCKPIVRTTPHFTSPRSYCSPLVSKPLNFLHGGINAGSKTHRITNHMMAVTIVLIMQLRSSQEEAQWCVAAVYGSKRCPGSFFLFFPRWICASFSSVRLGLALVLAVDRKATALNSKCHKSSWRFASLRLGAREAKALGFSCNVRDT
jgi:hypothetical protein